MGALALAFLLVFGSLCAVIYTAHLVYTLTMHIKARTKLVEAQTKRLNVETSLPARHPAWPCGVPPFAAGPFRRCVPSVGHPSDLGRSSQTPTLEIA